MLLGSMWPLVSISLNAARYTTVSSSLLTLGNEVSMTSHIRYRISSSFTKSKNVILFSKYSRLQLDVVNRDADAGDSKNQF